MKIQFIEGAKFTAWSVLGPLLVVIHWAATDLQGCINTFLHPQARGSAHYIVGETGKIVQMVDEKFIAWHAGYSRLKDYPNNFPQNHPLYDSQKPWLSLNICSLGIECAGPPSILKLSGWPEAEIAALIELCKDIKKRHPQIRITDHWEITEHGKSWSRSDVRDGKGKDKFPWKRLIQETGIEEA